MSCRSVLSGPRLSEARKLWLADVPVAEIASYFGCGVRTLYSIARRHGWPMAERTACGRTVIVGPVHWRCPDCQGVTILPTVEHSIGYDCTLCGTGARLAS